MTLVKKGDLISIDYKGTYKSDGVEFDSTYDDEPMKFIAGDDEIIDGLSLAVIGMEKGEKKRIIVEAKDGYGDRDEDLVYEGSKDRLPDDIAMGDEIGVQLGDDDEITPYWVVGIAKDVVTLDGNHPLSGHDLVFDIRLNEIIEEK